MLGGAKSRTRLLIALASLFLMIFAMTSNTPAQADSMTTQGVVEAVKGSPCAWAFAQLNHGTQFQAYSVVAPFRWVGDCGPPDEERPVRIAAQFWYYFEGSGWDFCYGDTSWRQPSGVWRDYARWHTVDRPPCGEGYYKAITWAEVWDGSQWIGAATDTYHHYLTLASI